MTELLVLLRHRPEEQAGRRGREGPRPRATHPAGRGFRALRRRLYDKKTTVTVGLLLTSTVQWVSEDILHHVDDRMRS